MSEGAFLGKGVYAVLKDFFRDGAEELRAPFRNLALGGHDLALAGAGGGNVTRGSFREQMRQWEKDAARHKDGIAYSKRLPSSNSKKNTGGGSSEAGRKRRRRHGRPPITAAAPASADPARRTTTSTWTS